MGKIHAGLGLFEPKDLSHRWVFVFVENTHFETDFFFVHWNDWVTSRRVDVHMFPSTSHFWLSWMSRSCWLSRMSIRSRNCGEKKKFDGWPVLFGHLVDRFAVGKGIGGHCDVIQSYDEPRPMWKILQIVVKRLRLRTTSNNMCKGKLVQWYCAYGMMIFPFSLRKKSWVCRSKMIFTCRKISQNGRRTPDCYDCRKINVCIRQELDDQICCVQLSNSLARSWTKWNKACGNLWPNLINCISEAMNCRQFWHEVNQIEDAKLGLWNNASFAGDLRHSQINVRRVDAHWIIAFVLFSLWMRKNQTAFSHSSSAVSEAISPDAGLRMDGLPVLQFGECVLETFSNKLAKGNIERHTRERRIPSQSHFDTCVFESINWYRTTKIPKPCTLNPILFVRIQCGSDPSVFQRTKLTLKIRRNNAQSQIGLLFERPNLDHSILTNYGRTTIGVFLL